MHNPNQDESELKELIELFRNLIPRSNILEIGSLQGCTLVEWMKYAEPKSTIISIDMMVPPQDPRYSSQMVGHQLAWPRLAEAYGHRLICLEGDSKSMENRTNVKEVMPAIDFLFIDGGHDYETCLADWTNYGALVRPGGLVAFHDIGGKEWPGVRRVWDIAKSQYKHQEIVRDPAHWGIGVLYK